MMLGEKIKLLRLHKKITQETLAEELNVSRSTIAKWESNSGIPELSDLIMISRIFHLSVDELIDDAKNLDFTAATLKSTPKHSALVCDGNYYDIDLKGWSTGVFDVLIIGEDNDFLFYKIPTKHGDKYGMIGKKYITNTRISKKSYSVQNDIAKLDRTYFYGKHVLIELAYIDGFIKGFFDFHNGEYLDVIVNSFSEFTIQLAFGREIEISNITKLEELY